MSEPVGEGKVLALIEAELRTDDPGLTALFDAFAQRSPALSAHRRWGPGRKHRKALAKRLLVLLLVPLTGMTVLAALTGGRKAADARLPCPPPPAAAGYSRPAGCPAAGQAHGPAPVPAHVRAAAGTGDHALGSIAEAYGDVIGLGSQTITAVDTWGARQSQAIRARICQSVPLPAGASCP